jgi:hypothetical protein
MEDSKQGRAETEKTTEELLQERQSDATSGETIKDVEANRANLKPGETDSGGTISPEGAFDESDESKETGPM